MNQPSDLNNKKIGGATDHLANERTFLAWIRTSIALMGFGFVIVKFALFLRQISMALGEKIIHSNHYSAIIGVLMVVAGVVMAALAYLRFVHIQKQILAGEFFPANWLSVLVTIFIIIGGILLVLYLLPNINF